MTGDRAGDHAEILAHHYASAAELAEATGALDPAPLRSRAVDHLLLAGERTLNADAARALQLFLRAVDLQPPPGDSRLPFTLCLATSAAYKLGDLDRCRALIEDAYRMAVELDDDLMIGLSLAWRSGFAGPDGRDMVERAIAILERHPPGRELASALVSLSALHMLEERPADALANADRALPIVEQFGDVGDLALVLSTRAWGRSDIGDPGGIDDGRRALELELQAGDQGAPMIAVNLAGLLWLWDGPLAAVGTYELAIREAERRRQTTVWSERELAWVMVELGRWDEALAITARTLAWARENSEPEVLGMSAGVAAAAHTRRGESDAAGAIVDTGLDEIRASRQAQVRQPGLIAAAEARLAQGRGADARQLLGELVAGRFGGMFTALHLPAAVETSIAVGDVRIAETLVDGTSAPGPRLAPAADLSRGLVLEAAGDHAAALELLDRSAGAFAELGIPYERARGLNAAARCLTALGRPAEGELRTAEAAALVKPLRVGAAVPATPPADTAHG